MDITGRLIKIMPPMSGQSKTTGNNWVKQEFVIETEAGKYPKKVCLTAWGPTAAEVAALTIGDELKVSFDVESREFNDKWYTDVKAWNIEVLSHENAAPASSRGYFSAGSGPETPPPPPLDADDLPF